MLYQNNGNGYFSISIRCQGVQETKAVKYVIRYHMRKTRRATTKQVSKSSIHKQKREKKREPKMIVVTILKKLGTKKKDVCIYATIFIFPL